MQMSPILDQNAKANASIYLSSILVACLSSCTMHVTHTNK